MSEKKVQSSFSSSKFLNEGSSNSIEERTSGTSIASSGASVDSFEPSCSTCCDLESQGSASTLSHKAGRLAFFHRLRHLDIRPMLPSWISRFLGYRPDGICHPIWALRWLEIYGVPLVLEEYVTSTFCTIVGMICVIMINTMTSFSSLPIPLSLGFVGALSIIMNLTPHAPAATPRNVIVSHLFASSLATSIAKVFLDEAHTKVVVADQMAMQTVWIWACVSVTLTMLFQKAFNVIHPPAGGTALLGTIQPNLIRIGWLYVGFVMSGALVMVGVTLVLGNVGRRSYPAFWFVSPDPSLTVPAQQTSKSLRPTESKLSCPSSEAQTDISYQSTKSSLGSFSTVPSSGVVTPSENSLSC